MPIIVGDAGCGGALAAYVSCLNDWNLLLNTISRTKGQVDAMFECVETLGLNVLACRDYVKAIQENRDPCSTAESLPCVTLDCLAGECVFSRDRKTAFCGYSFRSVCQPGDVCVDGTCLTTSTTTTTTSTTTTTATDCPPACQDTVTHTCLQCFACLESSPLVCTIPNGWIQEPLPTTFTCAADIPGDCVFFGCSILCPSACCATPPR